MFAIHAVMLLRRKHEYFILMKKQLILIVKLKIFLRIKYKLKTAK